MICRIAVFAFLNLSAFASAFTLVPTADAFVTTGPNGNLADNNYGGGGSVAVAAPGSAQGEFRSVMRFDLSPAVASFDSQFGVGNWSFQSVSLQLNFTAPSNPIFNISTSGRIGIDWMQNDSWTEGVGNPNLPGASGITFNSLQSTFRSGTDERVGSVNFDATTLGIYAAPLSVSGHFASDLEAGGNVSFELFGDDSSVAGVFNSRSFSTAQLRPSLNVEAVPEPTTIALAALGFAVIALRKRA